MRARGATQPEDSIATGAARWAAEPRAVVRAMFLVRRAAEERGRDRDLTEDRDLPAVVADLAADVTAVLPSGRTATDGRSAELLGSADVAAGAAVVGVEIDVGAGPAAVVVAEALTVDAVLKGRTHHAARAAVLEIPIDVGADAVTAELTVVAADAFAARRVVGRAGLLGIIWNAESILQPGFLAGFACRAGGGAGAVRLRRGAVFDARRNVAGRSATAALVAANAVAANATRDAAPRCSALLAVGDGTWATPRLEPRSHAGFAFTAG